MDPTTGSDGNWFAGSLVETTGSVGEAPGAAWPVVVEADGRGVVELERVDAGEELEVDAEVDGARRACISWKLPTRSTAGLPNAPLE